MENNEVMFNEYELDQIKEVINIGASHSSTALSQLVNKKVIISVPEITIDKVENISNIIGDNEKVVTAILLNVLGDAPGNIVFMFTHDDATRNFIKLISNKEESKAQYLDEFDLSILKETGNILAGASLNALSVFLGASIIQSVSESITDMLGSIVNTIMGEIGQRSSTAIICRVTFEIEGEDVKNPELYYFIDPKATGKILEMIKKKLGA
ncbi:hypothetical protein C0583_04905 [Candidatus Parcubacteria bacterium]|nr:MAG: hypothetical protein C0583_04905 [Candidatus Parcubacteria bacterium]